ncbi:MAG: hypothetical protein OXE55_06840 [Flavobacteriaceae bacterium]|nr:hypothetical protein [Flavobacteriaceae bacterium]
MKDKERSVYTWGIYGALIAIIIACNPEEPSTEVYDNRIKELSDEIRNIKKDLDELEKSYSLLTKENQNAMDAYVEEQKILETNRQNNKELSESNSDLKEEINNFENQIVKLNDDLNKINEIILLNAGTDEIIDEIEITEKEIDMIKKEVETLEQLVYSNSGQVTPINLKNGWYQINGISKRHLVDKETNDIILSRLTDAFDHYFKIQNNEIVSVGKLDAGALKPKDEQFHYLYIGDIAASEVVIIVDGFSSGSHSYSGSLLSKEEEAKIEAYYSGDWGTRELQKICNYYGMSNHCQSLSPNYGAVLDKPVLKVRDGKIFLISEARPVYKVYSDGGPVIISQQAEVIENELLYIDTLPYPTQFNFESTVGFKGDPIYSKIERNNFESYLEAFIEDAKRYGVDLSHIDTNDYTFNIVEEFPCPDGGSICFGGVLATAGSLCDSHIEVNILKGLWERGLTFDYHDALIQVLWHELGHTILSLDHVCEPYHILSTTDGRVAAASNAECTIVPAGKSGGLSFRFDHPDERLNWQRAVKDMFTKHQQISYDCGKGQKRPLHKHKNADGTYYWH